MTTTRDLIGLTLDPFIIIDRSRHGSRSSPDEPCSRSQPDAARGRSRGPAIPVIITSTGARGEGLTLTAPGAAGVAAAAATGPAASSGAQLAMHASFRLSCRPAEALLLAGKMATVHPEGQGATPTGKRSFLPCRLSRRASAAVPLPPAGRCATHAPRSCSAQVQRRRADARHDQHHGQGGGVLGSGHGRAPRRDDAPRARVLVGAQPERRLPVRRACARWPGRLPHPFDGSNAAAGRGISRTHAAVGPRGRVEGVRAVVHVGRHATTWHQPYPRCSGTPWAGGRCPRCRTRRTARCWPQ